MENNDKFNRILSMNTEAERRKIAIQVACSILSGDFRANGFRLVEIPQFAVTYADVLIAELNKKKD